MSNFLKKSFNIVSYTLLMWFSATLIVGSIFVSIYYAIHWGSELSNYINHFFSELYKLVGWKNPPVIANWLARIVFAVPFIFLSFLGFVILLLTQRTYNTNSEIKALRKEINLLKNKNISEYLNWTVDQLRKEINNQGQVYKLKDTKAELIQKLKDIKK